jgi:hypothetical protein
MGECEKGLTLERINNNGNYEHGNCKWATRKEQSNNKRDNVVIVYKNKVQTLHQWSEELGINYQALSQRIKKLKWSIEKAFATPVRKWGCYDAR